MIKVWIDESVLKERTRKTLARCQKNLNEKLLADSRHEIIKRKWKGKPTKAFEEIKRILLDACPGIELCCYCEHDIAKPIEHIFCKKLYPEWTFSFPNLIMICGRCNDLKLDAFAVFEAEEGDLIISFEKGGPMIKPSSANNVFINPRTEDPLDYFWVNLTTGYLRIGQGLDRRKIEKAKYTRDILELNRSRALMSYRHIAVEEYLNFVRHYIGCRDSDSFEALKTYFPSGSMPSKVNIDFDTAKERFKTYWLTKMEEHHFPTVWLEMKRQYKFNPISFERLYPKIAATMTLATELLS